MCPLFEQVRHSSNLPGVCTLFGGLPRSSQNELAVCVVFSRAKLSPHVHPRDTLLRLPSIPLLLTDGPANFTFITIKEAGHMVPQYQPQRALAFFRRWLANEPF